MSTPKYTTVDRCLLDFPLVGSVAAITQATITQYANDAEAVMDSYLVRFYNLPIGSGSGTIPLLTAISTDLTLYRLLSRRVFTAEQLKASIWPDRFNESMTLLQALSVGTTLLADNSGNVIPDRNDIAQMWSNTSHYLPTFTELNEIYSRVDNDKETDEANERGETLNITRL